MKNILISIFVIFIIIIISFSCSTTKTITRKSQLKNPVETGEISVIMKNGTLYKLTNYQLEDLTLFGSGQYLRDNKSYDFNDKLKLSDVSHIYSKEINIWKTLAATGLVGSFLFFAGDCINNGVNINLSINEQFGYYNPNKSSSCPSVYTFDGDKEYYESETYAGAIFKKAERTSYDILKHLKPKDGKYNLRLVNDRPETDYVNELKLLIADVPKNLKIVPDINGKLITISNSVLPNSCVDYSGFDQLGTVFFEDNKLWESDLNKKDFSKESDLKDGLILEFPKPANVNKAKLVIKSVNTRLLNFAFERLQELKGNEMLKWYYELDNKETERMKFFNFLLREGTLRIKIFENNVWKNAEWMIYVGPDIEKEQVSMLDITRINEPTLKIKLESTTDLWRINNIFIDYSLPVDVKSKELSADKITDESGNDITDLLAREDQKYYTSINGQHALLTFNEIARNENLDRIYILKTSGYYLQWFNQSQNEPSDLFERIINEPLFACKKFLPLWKEIKNK